MTTAEDIVVELQRLADTVPDTMFEERPGLTWGSERRYRQQVVIDAAGGVDEQNLGYRFPDGSAVCFAWNPTPPYPATGQWTAYTKEEADAIATGVKPNNIGLTRFKFADVGGYQSSLVDQLAQADIPHRVRQIPAIVGMGGNAYVVTYASRKTGAPVTVFVVPHRPEIDAFYEDYYYFEGMGEDDAQDRDWTALYDQVQELRS